MQDRFRFRAFHKPTKKMFEVYGFNEHFIFENSLDGIGTSETLPATFEDCELMQCREYKDKNKKLLYDGDIVVDFSKRIFIVEACKGGFHLQQIRKFVDGGYANDSCYTSAMFSEEYCEIIGNIHEYPQLLNTEVPA